MAPVTFGLLGPLEIRAGDRTLVLAGHKRRALLALLLLNHDQVVSTTRIVDALWGDEVPTSARTQVQSLTHALRQHLADWGGPSIETRAPGYVLVVEPDSIDFPVFERRAAQAREAAAAGRLEEASETFAAALAGWRGPALDGLEAPFVVAEAGRLEELRLLVLEQRIEADLALGRHALLVAELTRLVAEHPLRERLRAALMLALHRSGRRPEALDVYRRGREELSENLGLDPGRELRDLERSILRDEPSLHLASATAPPAVPAAVDVAPPVGSPRPRRARPRIHVAAALLAVAALLLTSVIAGFGLRAFASLPLVSRQASPPPSSAAPCTVQAQDLTDYLGRTFNAAAHCRQLVGSWLYANPRDRAPLAEVSFKSASDDARVVCQLQGRPNPVVQQRSGSWWVYAQGDTVNRGNHYGYFDSWAFLPANVLAQGGAGAVPGVPMCQLDLAVPGMPGVESPDYLADGDWHGQAGRSGRFRFTPVAGTSNLDGFVYGFDTPSPDTFVAATGPIEVRLTPPGPGPHMLAVRARDRAGNVSPSRSYAFEVGPRPADVASALASAPPGCSSGALCVYSGRNYTGSVSSLRDCNRSWATFLRDNVDESWFNNGPPGRYARIWQNPDFTGLSYALAPGTGVTDGHDGSSNLVDQGSSNDWPTAPGNPPPTPSACPD
jgi:DNA-binding SARP family transcriptional activator